MRSAAPSPPAPHRRRPDGSRRAWHGTDNLTVPKNLTILLLPSRSPELNPVENIWQYLRPDLAVQPRLRNLRRHTRRRLRRLEPPPRPARDHHVHRDCATGLTQVTNFCRWYDSCRGLEGWTVINYALSISSGHISMSKWLASPQDLGGLFDTPEERAAAFRVPVGHDSAYACHGHIGHQYLDATRRRSRCAQGCPRKARRFCRVGRALTCAVLLAPAAMEARIRLLRRGLRDRLRKGIPLRVGFVNHPVHVDTRDARPDGRDRAEDQAVPDRSDGRGVGADRAVAAEAGAAAGASRASICARCSTRSAT